jgi:hypothetical protein
MQQERVYYVDTTTATSIDSTWSVLYIVLLIFVLCALVSLCAVSATPTYYYVETDDGERRRRSPAPSEVVITLDSKERRY